MIKDLLFTILLILLVLGTTLGQARLVVDQSQVFLHDIRQETISHSIIHNDSTVDTLYLMWERNISDFSGHWDINICDQNRCYNTTDSNNIDNTLIIPPGEKSILDIRINPNQRFGNATVELSLIDLKSNDLVGQHSIEFEANLSSQIKSVPKIMLYPNPTTNILYLKNDLEVRTISIFSIVGKEIKTFNHMPGDSYELMSLPDGIYIVRLYDANNNSLKALRLQKK